MVSIRPNYGELADGSAAAEVETGHEREESVGEDEIRRVTVNFPEPVEGIVHRNDFEVFPLEENTHHLPRVGVVFNNQYFLHAIPPCDGGLKKNHDFIICF